MANVMFKRGLSTALPATGNAGSFYLTTDTNRLYVCNTEGGNLVELNQSINTVKSLGQLPTGTSAVAHGQYYYISDSNVLAFYDANKDNGPDQPKGGWVQINPDATLANKEEDTVVAGNDNAVKVTSTVEDTEGHSSVGHVTFTGTDAVTTKASKNNTVIIDAHDSQYELSSNTATVNEKVAAKIVLTPDENSTDEATEVNVYGGANITVENTLDGIKISAADAANMYNSSVGQAYDAAGAHTVTVTDGDGTKVSNKVTPTVKYGNGKLAVFRQEFEEDGSTPKGNPTAELDVYDKNQVDSLISMADAMHYKGIVTKENISVLDLNTAQNGDTYKVGEKLTNPVHAEIGDLVIAKGTEINGSLAGAPDAAWEVIPSGDSQVIRASVIANTIHKFIIEDNATGATDNIGTIEFFDDEEKNGNIKITSAAVTNSIGQETGINITVSHGEANTNTANNPSNLHNVENDVAQGTESEAEFTAVTTLSYDKNGHIVSAETGTLKVVDTHNHLVSNSYATEGGSDYTPENKPNNVTDNDLIGHAVQVTNTIVTNDESKAGTFTLDSDTLKLSQNNGTISIDMIWGSF